MPSSWFQKQERGDKDKSRKHRFRSIFRRTKKQQSEQDKSTNELPSPLESVEAEQKSSKQSISAEDHDVVDEIVGRDANVNEDTIQALFSGAPQFSVNSQNGRDLPAVTFPYDKELIIRDASDCAAIDHPAYSASTAYSHLVPGHSVTRHAPEYAIGIFEVPNMFTGRGNEPGKANVTESLENEDLLNSDPEKLGIRRFDIDFIGKRLIELGAIYQGYQSSHGRIHILKNQPLEELHKSLFTRLLAPPKGDTGTADPTGLKEQIEALLRVLNLKAVWYDFSSSIWRLRVGQLLWTGAPKSYQDDVQLSDRDVLILQILLSCELLLRLDAVAAVDVREFENEIKLSSEDISSYRDLETKKSKWDLMLARCFLRNIEVKMTTKEILLPPMKPFLSSVPFLSMSGITSSETTHRTVSDIAFSPLNVEQQISGLFHFAKVLQWQDGEVVEEQLREKLGMCGDDFSLLAVPSVYGTPLSSPRSIMSQRSSYFDSKPEIGRRNTPLVHLQSSSPSSQEQSGEKAESEPQNLIGGWLTRTYMTGFVLPGESISHFLISALLENDSIAISRLGDSASLYGGFSYRNRAWWSKTCIVGRVMSAIQGTRECMGWIHIPRHCTKIPDNTWFEIHCQDVRRPQIPRIRQTELIAADSDFCASKALNTVSTTDFILPVDPVEHPVSNMWFEGLHVEDYNAGQHEILQIDNDVIGLDDQTRLPPQAASLHFKSSSADQDSHTDIHVPLFFLVSFISAFPCFPPLPTIISSSLVQESSISGHVLHKSHTYKIINAHELLVDPPTIETEPSPQESELDPQVESNRPRLDNTSPEELTAEILVIDSRGDATLDMLARAWCAWKGVHALLARVKVTCLACAVREARALGVRVIIRLE